MKIFRSLLLVGLLGSCPLAAQSPVAFADAEGSWTITTSVTSRYLFRGVEIGPECLQPSLDYVRGPLAVGLWSSIALADHVSGDGDPEIDLYASYAFANASGTLSLVPGFTAYTYPDAKHANGFHRATFEPSLALNYTWRGIRFTPRFHYDLTLEGATGELTAAFAVPLTTLGTELRFNATAGTYRWNDVTPDAAPAVKNWGDYWFASVTVPFQVSARSQVALSVLYSEGHDNFHKQGPLPKTPNHRAGGRGAVTLSYAYTF